MITDKIQHVTQWALPPKIQETIQYLSTLIFLKDFERKFLNQNKTLRNKHEGEECYLLATGPSLKKYNLSQLKFKKTIAVSNFYVHPQCQEIKPDYYCIAPYHLPITEHAWANWMMELRNSCSYSTFFFGVSDFKRNFKIFSNLKENVNFIKFTEWNNSAYKTFNLSKPIPRPQSVSIMALLVALHLGFSKIYLLGCDHDWILHLGKSSHFYEESDHPLVKEGYNEWGDIDLEIEFQGYVRLWNQYKSLKNLAHFNNIEIINSTGAGLLDVFPREKFNS